MTHPRTDKRHVLRRLRAARDKVAAKIAERPDTTYGRGLSTEGFDGGYYAALNDVEAMLTHGYPNDHRGYWRVEGGADDDASAPPG